MSERRDHRPDLPDWHGNRATSVPTRELVQAWLDAYVDAWISYDEGEIADLWSQDAIWYRPFEIRARGRGEITAEWLAERNLFADENYDARYSPISIGGDGLVVTHGRTRYFDPATGDVIVDFDNVWVLRFDEQGRCSEFHEWYSGSNE
jgi:hypothetical protein